MLSADKSAGKASREVEQNTAMASSAKKKPQPFSQEAKPNKAIVKEQRAHPQPNQHHSSAEELPTEEDHKQDVL